MWIIKVEQLNLIHSKTVMAVVSWPHVPSGPHESITSMAHNLYQVTIARFNAAFGAGCPRNLDD